MSDLDISLPLTEEMLISMPMGEVFKIVAEIQTHCEEVTKQLKISSDNMKIIDGFIKNNLSAQ